MNIRIGNKFNLVCLKCGGALRAETEIDKSGLYSIYYEHPLAFNASMKKCEDAYKKFRVLGFKIQIEEIT